MSNEPYDPYIPAHAGAANNNKLAATQADIDNTVAIMQDNLNKVAQRGDHLDSLQDKTDNLASSASQFRSGANRVRKQMWWKDMKMRLCLIALVVIIVIVVIVVPVATLAKK